MTERMNHFDDPVFKPNRNQNNPKPLNPLKWVLFTILHSPFFLIGGIGLTAMLYTLVTREGIIGGILGAGLFLCAWGFILSMADLYK